MTDIRPENDTGHPPCFRRPCGAIIAVLNRSPVIVVIGMQACRHFPGIVSTVN